MKKIDKVLNLLDEMILQQKKQVRKVAETVVPNITEEDLLQPNDFKELEDYPVFRYEEGVLHGLLSVQSAFFAKKNEY